MTKAEREIRKMLEVAQDSLNKLWFIPKEQQTERTERETLMQQARVNAYQDCLIYSGLREGWGIEDCEEE
tara:strand:+ start:1952 stop:2161 length:210 start_codon:yes stop_codon:yes gene_type:complete